MFHKHFVQMSRELVGRLVSSQGRETVAGTLSLARLGHGATTFTSSLLKCSQRHMSNGAKNCSKMNSKSWILLQLQQQLKKGYVQLNDKLNFIAALFAKQCNVIAAQRMRRTCQIATLYRNLGYDKQFLETAVKRIKANLRSNKIPLLFGAAIFTWEKEEISEQELYDVADEIRHVQHKTIGKSCWMNDTTEFQEKWEKVVDHDNMAMFRKPVENSYLYEYKVYGTFTDIPARAFYNAQLDLDFRRRWDKLVVKLEVVDSDPKSGTEVVQWIMHYPYPMYSREYIYLRRNIIYPKEKLMVIVSRSVDHPTCPRGNKYVRVDTYTSNMVIKAHSTFDENGFDYVLTYFDDPKSQIPSVAYNWMASTGVPDFMDKMHSAAKRLHEMKTGRCELEGYQQDGRVPM